MRSEIEQHLRRELEAGVCTLDVFELEAVALCAYAFHAHALSGELPSPRALATRVGLTVRPGALPPGTPGMLVGRTIELIQTAQKGEALPVAEPWASMQNTGSW